MTRHDRRSRTVFSLIRICVTLLLFALLFWLCDPREVYAQLKEASVILLLCAAVIYVGSMALVALRWQILLRARGISVRMWRLVRYYFIGFFFNNFLPSSIGGDVTRIYNIMRHGVSMTDSFSCVFVERLIGFLAMAFLAVLSLAGLGHVFMHTPLIPLLTLALVVVFAVIAWSVFDTRMSSIARGVFSRVPWQRPRVFIFHVYDAVHSYRHHSAALWGAAGISLVYQCILGVFTYVVVRALGIEAPFWLIFALMQITSMAGVIPITLETAGMREFIFVIVLEALGYDKSHTLAALLVVRGISIAGSAIGGIFLLTGDAPHSSLASSDASQDQEMK